VSPAAVSTAWTAGATRSSWKRCQSSCDSDTPMWRRPLPALLRVPRRCRTTACPHSAHRPRGSHQRPPGAGGVGRTPGRTTPGHDFVARALHDAGNLRPGISTSEAATFSGPTTTQNSSSCSSSSEAGHPSGTAAGSPTPSSQASSSDTRDTSMPFKAPADPRSILNQDPTRFLGSLRSRGRALPPQNNVWHVLEPISRVVGGRMMASECLPH
jgi:hypothetical protein